MKIVFFGSRHVHDVVSDLNDNFDLELVVTTDAGMVKYCKSEGLPFAQVLNFDDKLITAIKELDADLGVVADFGLIIPKAIMESFPHGIINVHPSLLPSYRGPTPVQTALLNGDKITGISIIKIDEELDHGPIIYQEEYEVKPDDFTEKLLQKLFKRSGEILPDLITEFVDGKIDLEEQNDKKATYTKSLKKEDGYIDINNPPEKRKLERMINALSPWPGVWTRFRLSSSGQAKIIKLHPQGIIHVEGKKPMTYKDFMNGYENGKTFLQMLSLI